MKAVVHIGMEKAGSTSLQKYLYQNAMLLEQADICVAKSVGFDFYKNCYRSAKLLDAVLPLGVNTRLREVLGFKINEREKILSFSQLTIDQFKKEVLKKKSQGMKVMFFSDVSFISELTEDDEVERLFKFLSPLFDEIRIVGYVRRQDQWLSSSFSEILRRGFVPIDLFNLTTSDVFIKKRRLLAYKDRYDQWKKFFGEKNVLFKPFAVTDFHQNDFVADFCQSADLPFHKTKESYKENQSINVEGQLLLLSINVLLEKSVINLDQQQKCVCYINEHYPGKGLLPSNQQMEVIRAYYQPQNDFLASEAMILPAALVEERQLKSGQVDAVFSSQNLQQALNFIHQKILN